MTAAERMRRYRARKREPQQRTKTVRESARQIHVSERTMYYPRIALLGWDQDFLANYGAGKYRGRIGVQWLAEVAQYGSTQALRALRATIEREGSEAAHALWRRLIRRGARYEQLRRRRRTAAQTRRYYQKYGGRRDPHCGMPP